MTDYELTFIVDDLSDVQVDALFSDFDCITGETHTGEEFVTLTAGGDNAVEAAKGAHLRLMQSGIHVRRLERDLVTRREIAARLEKEPQTVGNWIRGDRRAGFPIAFHEVANGIWLWGDVVRWVRDMLGDDPAPGLFFPAAEDHDEFNACMDRQYADAPTEAFRLPIRVLEPDYGFKASLGHRLKIYVASPEALLWEAGHDFHQYSAKDEIVDQR